MMIKKIYISIVLLVTMGMFAQPNPQSKKITETFFPDYSILEDVTPALQKKKGFTDYKELNSFINDLVTKYPEKVSVTYIGESQKGRKIPMLKIHTNDSNEKIKVWMQGGLHGNEPASTEAMLYLAYKILNDSNYSELLKHLDLAIVPMANIDGYLKEDRYADNGLDLNRDQTKLMAPETVSLKQAFSDFSPEVGVDFHEYKPYRKDFARLGNFGITSSYDVMFLFSGNLNVPENLRNLTNSLFVQNAREVLDANKLTHHDYMSTGTYSGEIHFNQGSNNARSSATSYALTNTISTLIEVRGVGIGRTSFKRRIHTGFLIAISYLETATKNMALVKKEIETANIFQKYAYVTSKKNIYNDTIKAIDVDTEELIDLEVTIRDSWKSKPNLVRKRPKGYVIDASQKQLIEKLKILGASVEMLSEPKQLQVESYVVKDYNRESLKYEKMNLQQVKTELVQEIIEFPTGTFMVSLDQRNANLIIEVLEPEAPNSFISFGVLETEKGEKLPIYRLTNQ